MRAIRINKLVINIGTGSDEQKQANARRLIEMLTKEEAGRRDLEEEDTRLQDIAGPEDRRLRHGGRQREGAREEAFRCRGQQGEKQGGNEQQRELRHKGVHRHKRGQVRPQDRHAWHERQSLVQARGMRVSLRKRHAGKVPKYHKIIKPDELRDYIEEGVQRKHPSRRAARAPIDESIISV